MKVKKYEGRSLQEALLKVKEDLGDDGVILYTYQPRQSRFLRLFGPGRCLIFATREVRVAGSLAGAAAAAPALAVSPQELEELRAMMAHLRSQLALPGYREEVLLVYVQLLDGGVAQPVAREIGDRLEERAARAGFRGAHELRAAARALLAERLPVSGPIALVPGRCRTVALVGPTGVGKTTTIAKLAGNFVLREFRSVALVTLDNFRIAASDQLRKIAELMQVPLTVIDPEKDRPGVLGDLRGNDVVLLDTAGRSPNDRERLDELLPFLAAARPDEVHLVLAATTHPDNLLETARRFAPCRFTRVILTKLDEAVKLGPVVTALTRLGTPVSYVTHGQGIPRDIEVAGSDRLASLVLPERPRDVGAAAAGQGDPRAGGRRAAAGARAATPER